MVVRARCAATAMVGFRQIRNVYAWSSWSHLSAGTSILATVCTSSLIFLSSRSWAEERRQERSEQNGERNNSTTAMNTRVKNNA